MFVGLRQFIQIQPKDCYKEVYTFTPMKMIIVNITNTTSNLKFQKFGLPSITITLNEDRCFGLSQDRKLISPRFQMSTLTCT